MDEHELGEIVAQLRQRHPRFPPATIARLVTRVAGQYRDALIQTFVPLLVRREVADQLRYAENIGGADRVTPGLAPRQKTHGRSSLGASAGGR